MDNKENTTSASSMVFAPARQGMGVSIVMPSMLVFDVAKVPQPRRLVLALRQAWGSSGQTAVMPS